LELLCLVTHEEGFFEKADGGVVAKEINHDEQHEDTAEGHFKEKVLIKLE